MEFTPSGIADVWILELERYRDNRGWFARTWCQEEFRRQGLQDQFDQCSTSFNSRRGTIRGLHFQVTPYQETKLVRCTRGALFDVALDVLRRLHPLPPSCRSQGRPPAIRCSVGIPG